MLDAGARQNYQLASISNSSVSSTPGSSFSLLHDTHCSAQSGEIPELLLTHNTSPSRFRVNYSWVSFEQPISLHHVSAQDESSA